MIYSGYENGHYFVRFTNDIKLLEVMPLFRSGYSLVLGHMLVVKNKEVSMVKTEEHDRYCRLC